MATQLDGWRFGGWRSIHHEQRLLTITCMILIFTKYINKEESTNNEYNESTDIDIDNI